MDSRIKFVLVIAFILTASLTPVAAWPIYIFLLTLIISIGIVSGIGIGFIMKRSLLALPFLLAAIPIIFTIKGQAILSLPVGPWLLTASYEGVERFLSIAFKSWLSIQAAIILAASTRFPDLLQAMQAVGIPRLLVGMFGLMWRYLFVLADEALRLMRARLARSGHNEDSGRKYGGSLSWRIRMTGGMAGNLFLRAYERSDRIYVAMLSRGYDGEMRSLPLTPFTGLNWLILIISLIALCLLLVTGNLFWS